MVQKKMVAELWLNDGKKGVVLLWKLWRKAYWGRSSV